MARTALLTEVFVFISCGLYLVSNGQGCLPSAGGVGSLVGDSPIVLEGRVEETQPAAFQPADSGLIDAVVSVVAVFKGQMDSGATHGRIIVGPFGDSESAQTCVGGPRGVGDELVLFLSASDHTSATLRHFRLVANPTVADPESRRIVEEHAPPSVNNAHATACVETDYCLNGGTCYVMPALGRRFCKCTPGWQDNRCQERVMSVGENKLHDEIWIKEYFFLIIIGSAAMFLVLVAICILLVIFMRCNRPLQAKDVTTSGIRGIKYRNVNTDPENAVERIQVSQNTVAVQTESANGVSLLSRSDGGYHSKGSGKLRTNGATSADNAGLHRPLKVQDVREPGPHRGRPGQNGEVPVPRVPVEPSRNVVSNSFRGRDLQKNPLEGNHATNGVWVSRPLAGDEGSTQRGQRLDGVSVASRESDLNSVAV